MRTCEKKFIPFILASSHQPYKLWIFISFVVNSFSLFSLLQTVNKLHNILCPNNCTGCRLASTLVTLLLTYLSTDVKLRLSYLEIYLTHSSDWLHIRITIHPTNKKPEGLWNLKFKFDWVSRQGLILRWIVPPCVLW